MESRDSLIARKGEVQSRIRSLQPRVESARIAAENSSGPRRRILSARASALQSQLDALMQEEMHLRLEIDRAPR